MKEMHYEAIGGSDKRPHYQGSLSEIHSGLWFKVRGSQGRIHEEVLRQVEKVVSQTPSQLVGGHLYVVIGRLEAESLDFVITVLDYFAKTDTLSMPDILLVVWQGSFSCAPTKIISYVWDRRPLSKGYESYLSYIYDVSVESPLLDSMPVICDIPDVFSTDLPGLPLEHDIEFIIDLEMGPILFLWNLII
ncbi:hypothetical protein FXO38_16112 [Capsicum annuum]|nr:hypothetical protein FXO38_16112 [Capsicum annuum]